MKVQKYGKPALISAIAAAGIMALSALPASGSLRVAGYNANPTVNVSVSFNSHLPITLTDDDALAELQTEARKRVYGKAARDCAFLIDSIAASCRLTGINVSTQVQHQSGSNPPMLYLNGSAQFAITLKASDG